MADSKLHISDAVPRQMDEINALEKIEQSPEVNKDEEPLSLLLDAGLAPSCDNLMSYSCTCHDCMSLEEKELDLQLVNLQQHFFITRASNILKDLIEGLSKGESLAAFLPSFLFTCQPYFNHLESTARNYPSEQIPLSQSIYSQLLDFSEALVDKLEKLLLTFASHELLSLDETEPESISHFHIGQCELGSMRVTIFRYCQPTPYLGQVNTGLYKRMRWNVDRMEGATQQPQKEESETDNTEFYFLCVEDINTLPKGENESLHDNVVRVWSIGQWIQVLPETNDIEDWVLCRIPQGTYLKRVILGTTEPSCRIATDNLLQLLMLDQKNSCQ